MQRTLTKFVGDRKFIAVEDQSLIGCNYGRMKARDNRIRVSPAVFKLMQDDFDRVASVLNIKISKVGASGGQIDERVLPELQSKNHSAKALSSLRRRLQHRIHRKPKKAA